MQEEKMKPWKDDLSAVMQELAALKEQVQELKEQVNSVDNGTKDMLSAFQAAQGAFIALDWLAKTVKPVIVIVSVIAGTVLWIKGVKV